MDRELMRSDYSDDIQLLDWTGNEHYEDNIDDDISFAPEGGALVPLYDKLRNSKRGGLHISKGNSSYYNAVMSSMDSIIVMMGSDFTGNTEMIQNVSAEAEEAHMQVWTEFRSACGQ